jgi:hypothetical protein
LLSLDEFEAGAPIVTAAYLYHAERQASDEKPSSLCPWCGNRTAVSNDIVDVLTAFAKHGRLDSDAPPSRVLDPVCWREPRLDTACPGCGGRFRYNPFIVGSRAKRGLRWLFSAEPRR